MSEVFISYKSNDPALGNNDATVANELCQQLEAAGISCWIAPRNIPYGSRYDDEIVDAIEGCKAILVVFSSFTDKSKWMPDEARLAYENGKTVFSFRLDNTPFKKKWKLYLGGSQMIDAQGDYRERIPALIEALRFNLGKSDSQQASTKSSNENATPCDEPENVQWPDAEKINVDSGQAKEDSKSKFSWGRRLKGALKGAGAGYLIGGPLGAFGGAAAGAAKPDLLEFGFSENDDSIKTFTVNDVTFNMIRVKGGTFTMGATPEQLDDVVDSNETPAHEVTLSTYHIGQTQVTQELWQAVMGNNPSYNKGDKNLPVDTVSWDDCQEFITRLNTITGLEFRLPTEAEWEFAARGGNESKHYKYSGSNDLPSVAWYNSAGNTKTYPVATKDANELGLFDMSGNVLEWCNDWFGDVYRHAAVENPTGPSRGSEKVLRGGSTCEGAWLCRVSCRFYYLPNYKRNCFGLRLAL